MTDLEPRSSCRVGAVRGKFVFYIWTGTKPPLTSPSACSMAASAPGHLGHALREASENGWAGMRSAGRARSQSAKAIETLSVILKTPDPDLAAVTKDDIKLAVRQWQSAGIKPNTIAVRLSCLSTLGVDVSGCRPRKRNTLKWWLAPDAELRAVEVCGQLAVETGKARYDILATYIRFVTRCGLRVEEALRLTWADLILAWPRVSLSVPGTKTQTSQATLLLAETAARVLAGCIDDADIGYAHVLTRCKLLGRGQPIFPMSYYIAMVAWQEVRQHLDIVDPSKATLKALRRSAARHLHGIRGMPLDMLRQYLRHGTVQTTMGYLSLTGGYNDDEMSKWLR